MKNFPKSEKNFMIIRHAFINSTCNGKESIGKIKSAKRCRSIVSQYHCPEINLRLSQ